mmetsp:Transcript_27866/g.81910  ORF Transcript_27866/g.81910 Transcript_27866/m.81910 type:complete len:205 (+) Transcript_27866:76-690(+)
MTRTSRSTSPTPWAGVYEPVSPQVAMAPRRAAWAAAERMPIAETALKPASHVVLAADSVATKGPSFALCSNLADARRPTMLRTYSGGHAHSAPQRALGNTGSASSPFDAHPPQRLCRSSRPRMIRPAGCSAADRACPARHPRARSSARVGHPRRTHSTSRRRRRHQTTPKRSKRPPRGIACCFIPSQTPYPAPTASRAALSAGR